MHHLGMTLEVGILFYKTPSHEIDNFTTEVFHNLLPYWSPSIITPGNAMATGHYTWALGFVKGGS
jgi:hypothetical protein